MFKSIYPLTDATIYEYKPERNTGADQILELTKRTNNAVIEDLNDPQEVWDSTTNSRILMKFDINSISQSISQGRIGSDARFYLDIKSTETYNLPIEYTIDVFPLSGSFVNGTGFYNNRPQITNGVSWIYRTAKSSGVKWSTASFNPNSTGSWSSVAGGGTWHTTVSASQSFIYQPANINVDVTSIVKQWISGSITNDGFIIKFNDTVEKDSSIVGSIKFFSKDTHTIYIPKLNIYWSSIDHSGTGSLSEVQDEDFVIYPKNLRTAYGENEIAKIRLGVRPRYPVLTYSTSSVYTTNYRLPITTYYSIMDSQTDEVVVGFDQVGTAVNCDSRGNYIKHDMNSLLPERMYRFVFKVEFSDGTIRYVDNDYLFSVLRRG